MESAYATGLFADGAALGGIVGLAICLIRGQENFDTIASCTITGAVFNVILYRLL